MMATTTNTSNIFSHLPPPAADEFFETLLQQPHIKIERIVSHGHSSPSGFWFDQDMNEWVIVLKGRGRVMFEDESSPLELKPGDYLQIPAHTRHRVDWTDPEEDTVWLAVYY